MTSCAGDGHRAGGPYPQLAVGVTGVPFFIVHDSRLAVSGARSPESLGAGIFQQVMQGA